MTEPRISRSDSWRREFVAAHGARCHYCNRAGHAHMGPDNRPWHIDHKEPLSRGGEDDERNLALACKRCNLAKGVQSYSDFVAFAHAAFWVPDDWRASEFELDRLMDLYTETADESLKQEWEPSEPEYMPAEANWRTFGDEFAVGYIDARGRRQTLLKWAGEISGKDTILDKSKHERQLDSFAGTHLDLIVLMRRLIPALVAEIRMLRATEREGTQEAA